MHKLLLLISCIFGLARCQQDCFGEGFPSSPDVAGVSKGADNFALKLFSDIAISYPLNSIVLSPYSVWSVLNLAYFGSAGPAEQQLGTALGVPSKSDAYYGGRIVQTRLTLNEGTTFDEANKAYFDTSMNIRECALNKLPEVERVNFKDSISAAKLINADVSRATRGKINKFLNAAILRNARFVLLNAVYFKGTWVNQFDTAFTSERSFYDETRKNNLGKIKMMKTNAKLRHGQPRDLEASVLELPYENSNISMILILPNVNKSVNSVLTKLNSDRLDIITKDLKEKMVHTIIPRFKMTTRIAKELKEGLKNLGVTDLFNAAQSDLSNFIPDESAYVDQALHHSTIEVSEEGTVASAATGLIGTRSGASNLAAFVAERPFLFLIRDRYLGVTLFMGVFRDPKQTTEF